MLQPECTEVTLRRTGGNLVSETTTAMCEKHPGQVAATCEPCYTESLRNALGEAKASEAHLLLRVDDLQKKLAWARAERDKWKAIALSNNRFLEEIGQALAAHKERVLAMMSIGVPEEDENGD